MSDTTRLSRFEAARVIAQRDFRAILFSRAFLFFLLGPLFPIIIGVLAGGSADRCSAMRTPGLWRLR